MGNQVKKSVDARIMVFSRRFRMEAKEFALFVNNFGIFRMTKWGSKLSDAIYMGTFGAPWMVNMVDKLRRTSKLEDFVSKFNELKSFLGTTLCESTW